MDSRHTDPQHADPQHADPQHWELGRLLARAGQALGGLHRRAAAVHGLTPTSLGALGVLADGRAVSHRELAAALGITPATLTPVVDTLAAAGEVRRDRDVVDRRVVRVSITPAGRARLAESFAAVAAELAGRVPRPSAADETTIRGYLVSLLDALGGSALGESAEAGGRPEPALVGEVEPCRKRAHPAVEFDSDGHLRRARVRMTDSEPVEPGR